jgi:hypothetical protein
MSGGGSPPQQGLSQTLLVDLRAALTDREKEAVVLKAAGHDAMSLAIRLYCVEIQLKIMICKHLGLEKLPKVCITHNLAELLVFSGCHAEVHGSNAANPILKPNWDKIADFSHSDLNSLRYRPASEFQSMNSTIEAALDDPRYGVWPWLLNHS